MAGAIHTDIQLDLSTPDVFPHRRLLATFRPAGPSLDRGSAAVAGMKTGVFGALPRAVQQVIAGLQAASR